MNRIARRGTQAAGWSLGKMKTDTMLLMAMQHAPRKVPLPGRPQVLCLRLSSVEPDKYADWQKNAVDRLRVPLPKDTRRLGLSFITDDRPACVDLHAWWEPARRGQGCVVIEVRTGA